MEQLDRGREMRARYANLQRSKDVKKEKKRLKRKKNRGWNFFLNVDNLEFGVGMFIYSFNEFIINECSKIVFN
jgi:hypothetical protein